MEGWKTCPCPRCVTRRARLDAQDAAAPPDLADELAPEPPPAIERLDHASYKTYGTAIADRDATIAGLKRQLAGVQETNARLNAQAAELEAQVRELSNDLSSIRGAQATADRNRTERPPVYLVFGGVSGQWPKLIHPNSEVAAAEAARLAGKATGQTFYVMAAIRSFVVPPDAVTSVDYE